MKTFLFFFRFTLSLLYTIPSRIRIDKIKKRGLTDKAAEKNYRYVENWSRMVLKLADAKVEVIGRENVPKETCLFVGNHQSYFDIPLMLGCIERPIGFIAKKELTKVPIISRWMKEIHCIFMDRENIREAVKSINEGVEKLKNGQSMIIFPEGTRSKNSEMKEFKKGSMKLALKAGVPIVPIAINGTYRLFEGNNNKIDSAKIKLSILKPIFIKNLSNEEQGRISEIVQQAIQNELKKA